MDLKFKKIIAREFIILLIVLTIGLFSYLLIYPYNSSQQNKKERLISEIRIKTNQLDSLKNSENISKEDPIKNLYGMIKGNKLFLDENDFRVMLLKDPQGTYSVISNDKNARELFLDYSDFEKALGLKKEDPIKSLILTIDEEQLRTLWDFDSKEGRHLSLEELKKTISNPKGRRNYFIEFNAKMGFKDYEEFIELIQTDKSRNEYKEAKRINDSVKVTKSNTLQQELDKLKNQEIKINNKIFTKQEQNNFTFWVICISAIALIFLRYLYHGLFWSIRTLRAKDSDNKT